MSDDPLYDALITKFETPDIMRGKGGYWVRGHGFITKAKARKLTGIKALPREKHQKVAPWGDYATIAMLNQPRKRTPEEPAKKPHIFKGRRRF
jgi:hypothetical protein